MTGRRAASGDHHALSLVLVLILVGVVIAIAQRVSVASDAQSQTQRLQDDLAREQTFSREVFAQNQALRDANALLRERVLQLSENLSVTEERVQACVERVPQLQQLFQDTGTLRSRVALSDLTFTPDTVTLNMRSLTPGIVAPSGSMLPLLREDTIVLETTPKNTADIFLGDIIIFEAEGNRIIHRVIKIGWDEQGWFAVTRGDNNPREDPYRVRFEQVRGVVVGIIY